MILSPTPSNGSPLSPNPCSLATALAYLHRTVILNSWIPQSVRDRLTSKQAEFLLFTGREALYGGAAGGGKSYALLMAALQHVDEPGYHALILRRTYKQLSKAESIMSISQEWLANTPARWKGDDHTWVWPNGSTLEFGHMEHEKNRFDYQGAAYHFVGFDELTQFEEPMYTYLFSRQRRRADSAIPMRMRATSNPGGIGHDFVKSRFVDPSASVRGERQFFPAKVTDNPNIDIDAYVASLAHLDPVTRAQLLAGDWDVFTEGKIKREWLNKRWRRSGDYYLLDSGTHAYRDLRVFLTVDSAASVKTSADYTVIGVWGMTKRHELIWLDCVRGRWEVPDIPAKVEAVYKRWRAHFVGVEGGGTQQGVYQACRRRPMAVRELKPGSRDKLIRATPFINLCADGRVYLPEHAHWLDDAFSELLRFTGDDKQDEHDDIVDVAAWAGLILTGKDHAKSAHVKPFAVAVRTPLWMAR